jgi:hypothetical protein
MDVRDEPGHDDELNRIFLQPGQHIAGVSIGRKHRIEHMGEAAGFEQIFLETFKA